MLGLLGALRSDSAPGELFPLSALRYALPTGFFRG